MVKWLENLGNVHYRGLLDSALEWRYAVIVAAVGVLKLLGVSHERGDLRLVESAATDVQPVFGPVGVGPAIEIGLIEPQDRSIERLHIVLGRHDLVDRRCGRKV